MQQRLFFLIFSFICLTYLIFPAQASVKDWEEWVVDYRGEPQVIHYRLYQPSTDGPKNSAVLICVGGLPIVNGEHRHSSTKECSSPQWITFAEEYNVAILGVGFLFDVKQWESKESYQHAEAWSGPAVWSLLEFLSENYSLDLNRLYAFGISAGAQFSVRFAQLFPNHVKAVAAHAAGGYDFPEKYITPKFLITVGELDEGEITRVQWAEAFVKAAEKQNIDVRLEIVPNIGHVQTEYQNELSRNFFERAQ